MIAHLNFRQSVIVPVNHSDFFFQMQILTMKILALNIPHQVSSIVSFWKNS